MDRITWVALPWAILVFNFLVNLVIRAEAGGPPQGKTGGVFAIYVFFFVLGSLSIGRSLPFGLTLGVSRRSYYAGTVLLAVGLAVVYGLMLALLQIIERANDGWGMTLHYFRVPYILNGAWYLTWLTSSVLLTVAFVYGMWFGLVYRRLDLVGLLVFIAAQIVVLLAGALIVNRAHAWASIGRFFATLSPAGLTGLLAGLAMVLLAGRYATMRRITV